ncbi:DNA (cytosine-5)-methyltransferase 1 [Patescibacteria group bacterium]|nr:DNA (cytosine-5)-methyltransferase 1 [Patescibacteria group bacterium]
MKVISLFSGAGGMDIGFEEAGFEIVVAVEQDSACCDTLRVNRPNLKVIEQDISTVKTSYILQEANLKPLEAALVIGGPPCQSFSLAGKRMGLNDKRGMLLLEFVRVVREALPIAFVMENVQGMMNWENGKAIQAVLNEFKEPITYLENQYQYEIGYQVLNAADYGVAQFRERLFIVGNRLNKGFLFPQPTHSSKESSGLLDIFGHQKMSYKTTWDAIGSLPPANEPSDTAKRVSQTIKARIEKHGY